MKIDAQKQREKLPYGSWLAEIAKVVPDRAIETEAIRITHNSINRVDRGSVCQIIEVNGTLYMGDPDKALICEDRATMFAWASQDVVGCWQDQRGNHHFYEVGQYGDVWVVIPNPNSRITNRT